MKKRKIIGAVTALGAALNFSGCIPTCVYGPPNDFNAEENYGAVVYGPPEWFEETTESTTERTSATTVETTAETNGETTGESDIFETSTFKPELNTAEPVYGPPEWFDETEPVVPTLEETTTAAATDITTTEESTLTSPDTQAEVFDPELNESFEVYGPPEWFDRIDTDKIEEVLGEFFPIFSETENIPTCVYGPPEWFENAETDEQD